MFALPESFPQPTSSRTRNGKYGYHQQVQRDVTSTWVLNPEAEGVPSVRVTLTTSHSVSYQRFEKSSAYVSTMTWGTHEPAIEGSVFSVETWSSDNASVRISSSLTPRHSLKAMQAQHEAALQMAADYWDSGTQVKGVFLDAATKSGLFETAEA